MTDAVVIKGIDYSPPKDGPAPPPNRPEYIPEKFWDGTKNEVNVQALANSYAELEKRAGKPEVTPPTPKETPKATPGDAGVWSESNLTKWANAAAENGGHLPEEVYAEIPVPRPFVDMWIETMKGKVQGDAAKDYEFFGGEDGWKDVQAWASESYDQEGKQAFAEAVKAGGKLKEMAMKELKSQYEEANGKPAGRKVSGNFTGRTEEGYPSTERMMEDMRNPRYKQDSGYYDPAFAAEVRRRTVLMKPKK